MANDIPETLRQARINAPKTECRLRHTDSIQTETDSSQEYI